MFKQILTTFFVAFCGCALLQAANEEETPTVIYPIEQTGEANQNLLTKLNSYTITPGILICDAKEDHCVDGSDKEKSENESSNFYSFFCDPIEGENILIACKHCEGKRV